MQQSDVMAGRLYKKAYTTKPLDCRRGNNDGYKAARVGDVLYYGLDEDVNYTAVMHFYQEAELGLYEQIKSEEIYLRKLLDEVIEKQGIIREKLMGESASVNLRIDKNLKAESEKLFDKLGLNMTTAVTVFLRQAVREQALPFRVSASNGYDNVEPYMGQSNQFSNYKSYIAESLRQSDCKVAEGTMKYYTANEILSGLEEVLNEKI